MDQRKSGDRYIIFADDDPDDLDLITSMFKEEAPGVSILEFHNGHDLLKFLDTNNPKPDLIVLDINMPRINGKDTLRRIRNNEEFNTVPVVLFSTTLTKEDEAFCKSLNASWIHKPVHFREMKEVARILGQFFKLT